MTKVKQRFRCAIYTRKSTEEGLEQAFNTLDAQRASCEAYILSQAGEGWELVSEPYDDGGWSGGNMERPALKRLLGDIDRGRIDIVVVYKVDRLTRNLMDFAPIVETFDARQVSFVSVTQAFNTTNSMGRLTLNVLLSFAQFEREVTGERIRDKIAASKARGMWMGGNVPLGYNLGDRELLINPHEAQQVRHIFTRYLELGSIVKLAHELDTQGITSKRWTSRNGIDHGGLPMTPGAVAHILNNRIYLGEIVHKGQAHTGNHAALLDPQLFDDVQAALANRRVAHRTRATKAATSPLTGKICDAMGQPLHPSFSYGRGRICYRYYVGAPPALSSGAKFGSSIELPRSKAMRISAERLERDLVERLAPLLGSYTPPDRIFAALDRIKVSTGSLILQLNTKLLNDHASEDIAQVESQEQLTRLFEMATSMDPNAQFENGILTLTIPKPVLRRNRSVIPNSVDCNSSPLSERDSHAGLADLIRTSHRKLLELNASPLQPETHSQMRVPNNEWTRERIAIGLLAPDIQKQLLNGKYPARFDETRLFAKDLPLDWNAQRRFLGLNV